MRVKLIREARIRHKAGEIVEVSPAEADFLIATGSAVCANEAPRPRRETKKKEPEKK